MKKLDEIKKGIIAAQEEIITFNSKGWRTSLTRARHILKAVRLDIVALEKELLEQKKESKLKSKLKKK